MTDDRTVKAVLAELKKAVGAKGKVVIDAYNYDADHAVNVDSISSKRADELEAVCKALGVMLVGQDGSNREATELADKIVLQIEGLFPIDCQDCGEKYRVKLGTTPPISCFLCGQGAHTCMQSMGGNRKGSVWVCSYCWNKNATNTDNSVVSTQEAPIEDAEEQKDETKDRDEGKSLEINPGNVCKHYLNRKCRHGRNGTNEVEGKACPKLHPKLCKRFCNYGSSKRFGCAKGGSCKFYHPPLCKGSEARRECYDKQCSLVHLLHTKRDRGESTSPPGRGDRSVQGRTRKAPSQAPGGRTEEFNSKRPRQEPGNRNEKEACAQPDERVTQDFLEKKLEVLKAEIQQSVMLQLMEFKSFLERQCGTGLKPNNPWGLAGTKPLYQTFAS